MASVLGHYGDKGTPDRGRRLVLSCILSNGHKLITYTGITWDKSIRKNFAGNSWSGRAKKAYQSVA